MGATEGHLAHLARKRDSSLTAVAGVMGILAIAFLTAVGEPVGARTTGCIAFTAQPDEGGGGIQREISEGAVLLEGERFLCATAHVLVVRTPETRCEFVAGEGLGCTYDMTEGVGGSGSVGGQCLGGGHHHTWSPERCVWGPGESFYEEFTRERHTALVRPGCDSVTTTAETLEESPALRKTVTVVETADCPAN